MSCARHASITFVVAIFSALIINLSAGLSEADAATRLKCNKRAINFKRVNPTQPYSLKPTQIRIPFGNVSDLDYMGLIQAGEYNHPSYGESKSLLAVFTSAARDNHQQRFLFPAQFGNQTPGPFTKDFGVTRNPDTLTGNQTTIVRIPVGTKRLLFTAGYPIHIDNTDLDRDFGACVTFPNTSDPSAVPATEQQAVIEYSSRAKRDLNELLPLLPTAKELPRTLTTDSERKRGFYPTGTLGIESTPPVPNPQYRGWYPCRGGACFMPWRSQWSLVKDDVNRIHRGIDIFAPVNTFLRASVDGFYTCHPNFDPTGWGLMGVLSFSANGKMYHLIYAHLRECWGSPKGFEVEKERIIGKAGCSGNTEDIVGTKCGVELNQHGARTDHVHIQLIEKNEFVSPVSKYSRNPVEFFGWSIKTPQ